MIMTRPDFGGADAKVEVEAKVGVLRDNVSGRRLAMPVLVETSQYAFSVDWFLRACSYVYSPCSGFGGHSFRI